MSKSKKGAKVTPTQPEKKSEETFSFGLKEVHLWGLTLLAFLGFYYYSTKSVGYYQDDEIAHFMSMMGFWDNPTSIMGNWSKPGYKLLYALPAKLGYNFVLLVNCAVSAIGCYLAAKVAGHFNKKAAVFALILAATQPVWIEMSFRNYADILSGVLLIAAIYFALKEKWLVSSLFLSYDILVRQEFLILLLMLGLYLLIKRKWVPMLALGVFPLLYALWTLNVHDNFWYMITEAQETSAAYAKEYPKQGLEHYPFMSAVIFGALQIALLAVAVVQIIVAAFGKNWFKEKESQVLFVFIPFAVFFGIHMIFNMKSPEIGPATGGNLRYMAAIAPLVGALGALSLFYLKKLNTVTLGVTLAVVGIAVAFFMTYDHNYVKFAIDSKTGDKIKSWLPFGIFLTGAALYYLPVKGWGLVAYITAFGFLFLNGTLKPYKLTPENIAVQKCVKKISKNSELKNRKILSNHSTLWFFWLKENNELVKETGTLDSASIEAAPVGALFVWESHYGYRPNRTPGSVKPEYFNNERFKFREPLMVTATNQRFQIAVFEKIK
jgi:hypothetical protein